MTVAMVYPRDASWHRSPATTGARTYHWPKDSPMGLSACGASVLIEDQGFPPTEIPITLRCRRSGCRQRWTAFDTPEETR